MTRRAVRFRLGPVKETNIKKSLAQKMYEAGSPTAKAHYGSERPAWHDLNRDCMWEWQVAARAARRLCGGPSDCPSIDELTDAIWFRVFTPPPTMVGHRYKPSLRRVRTALRACFAAHAKRRRK